MQNAQNCDGIARAVQLRPAPLSQAAIGVAGGDGERNDLRTNTWMISSKVQVFVRTFNVEKRVSFSGIDALNRFLLYPPVEDMIRTIRSGCSRNS